MRHAVDSTVNSFNNKYTSDELHHFREYYGAPPEVLDGFSTVKHAERQPFLVAVTET